jgi:hypothetical protein
MVHHATNLCVDDRDAPLIRVGGLSHEHQTVSGPARRDEVHYSRIDGQLAALKATSGLVKASEEDLVKPPQNQTIILVDINLGHGACGEEKSKYWEPQAIAEMNVNSPIWPEKSRLEEAFLVRARRHNVPLRIAAAKPPLEFRSGYQRASGRGRPLKSAVGRGRGGVIPRRVARS